MTTLALRTMRTPALYHSLPASTLLHHIRRSPFPSSQLTLLHLHRLSSTSTATSAPPRSRTSTSTSTSTLTSPSAPAPRPSRINPLRTTLPPPLELPTRAPSQPFFFAYAFSLGKAYLTFYKTGVKAIWTNFRASRSISASSPTLSRAEFQLLRRSAFDVRRIPVFALVFIFCGEFTPLIVLTISGIVPSVCRIPKQVEGDREKLEARRRTSFRNLTAGFVEGEALGREQLLHISWSLGLSSSVWDHLGGRLPGLPTPILMGKVGRWVKYLERDDGLIKRDGGVKKMEAEEVTRALVERGIDVMGTADHDLRKILQNWLDATEVVPIERLLLTRPNVWPSKKS